MLLELGMSVHSLRYYLDPKWPVSVENLVRMYWVYHEHTLRSVGSFSKRACWATTISLCSHTVKLSTLSRYLWLYNKGILNLVDSLRFLPSLHVVRSVHSLCYRLDPTWPASFCLPQYLCAANLSHALAWLITSLTICTRGSVIIWKITRPNCLKIFVRTSLPRSTVSRSFGFFQSGRVGYPTSSLCSHTANRGRSCFAQNWAAYYSSGEALSR